MGETREVRRKVQAPPERLWAMVTDVTRMGEWSPETFEAEWLDGATGPAVGARFRGRNRHRSKWSTTCEVEVADPGREFTFAVDGAQKPTTRWRYLFIPTEDGGTEVVESFELVRPLSRFTRLLTRLTTGVKDREADLEDGMRQTLARLKEAAEAG